MSCRHPDIDAESLGRRAHELVKDDISKSLCHLASTSEQSKKAHKITAMSHVGFKLLTEVEELQNCASLSNQIDCLKSEQEKINSFYQQREVELNSTIAAVNDSNSELSLRNASLESEMVKLTAALNDSQRELNLR